MSTRDADDADLADRRYRLLPLGAIEPRGWLRRQLRIQADGLTGHLDEFWPDLADNRWRGGENDGWERGPYYADGLVPLAHLLDDDDLRAKADAWVEAFLAGQDGDGWIGPAAPAGDYEAYDPWPNFVVLKVLDQHYRATGDDRAVETALEFCRYLRRDLAERPLFSWGRFRWADLLVSVHRLYERTGEEWLLELAATVAEQGYDWTEHFLDFPYPGPQSPDEAALETHVVNNAMGIKAPAVRFRQSGDDRDRAAVDRALASLDAFHGQVTGVFTGDEHFGGRDPSRGTELCAVVEYMYSLETLLSLLGAPAFGDRLERIAFNALPAAFKPDMWAHQYDQQANQLLCDVAERCWTNGPDANLFGLEPHFGCCTANMHQGWPKFATHLWMRSREGLAAVAYAPCELRTAIDGVEVTIAEETRYPFEDEIGFEVDADEPVAFPLELRIPDWATGATLRLPDGTGRPAEPGSFATVEREWCAGDAVSLELSVEVTAERRFRGAVALRRGPLAFSLPVPAEWKLIDGTPPHGDWELYPTAAWNYGLALEADDVAQAVDLDRSPPGETPFSPEDPPLELSVSGRQVPAWALEDNRAGPIPRSPTRSSEPLESLALVPYGCTNLRVTEFPLVEK